MISALMPFLGKSPATSATHNTPWLGETAENATLTLSAAKLGRAKKITSKTLNPRTGNFLMPDRDRGHNIMDPGRLFCVRRRFRKPSLAAVRRTIVDSMSRTDHIFRTVAFRLLHFADVVAFLIHALLHRHFARHGAARHLHLP